MSNNTWIRKDWLNKLGLKEPKSKDELFNVLKAFKENSRALVGDDSIIPLGIDGTGTILSTVRPSFLRDTLTEEDYQTKVIYPEFALLAFPEYKSFYAYWNKIYNEK